VEEQWRLTQKKQEEERRHCDVKIENMETKYNGLIQRKNDNIAWLKKALREKTTQIEAIQSKVDQLIRDRDNQ
jgi:multidrug resistance efflux pump